MKMVFLDGYTLNPGDISLELLEQFGELTFYDRTPDDPKIVLERIGDAEILFTNKVHITREIIFNAPNLRYIGVMATGYNAIDIDAAREKRIPVTNIPSYGTAIVGQFAIALLLEICNQVGHHNRVVHEGKWIECPDYCFWDYPSIELMDKTIGIIGLGRIGKTTARIAKAMGMKVIATSADQDEEGAALAEYVSLDALLSGSDVIALHCPLTPETNGLINSATIEKMKDGVIIINNSRGQLVVEQDLADALNSGKVYFAGLDVISEEPMKADNPLLKAKNCIITPHISWAARESRMRLVNTAAENLRHFLDGDPINVVNK